MPVEVFSIPAFFIVLREVMEACLVVGIALAYFNKTGCSQYNRWVWFGATAGILVSGTIGIVLAAIYYAKGNQLLEDNAEKIFEGTAFLVAAALLTWMIVWMMIMGKNLHNKIEQQLENVLEDDNRSTGSKKLGVFTMVFIQVLREGVETFIFLFGSANASDYGSWRAIPLPGILAVIVGVAISFFVFKGLLVLDIHMFFNVSSFILIAFAAGLVSHAFHEIQEVDAFGPWDPKENRDWYNFPMWDTKVCCDDEHNEFFAMLRALFGYQDTPTFVEWISYFIYWFLIIVVFVSINWEQIITSTVTIRRRAQSISSLVLLFTFVGFIYTLINRTWIGLVTMTSSFVLSIITVFFVFENATKLLSAAVSIRKSMLLLLGTVWAVNAIFISALHFAQLGCLGREGCSLKPFFFFGLIVNHDFASLGRTMVTINDHEKAYWPAIAVLSISLILSVLVFAGLAFRLILMAYHTGDDGVYHLDSKLDSVSQEHNEYDNDHDLSAESQLEHEHLKQVP